MYHILNGDNLAFQLKETKINLNHIVCRECLIDGPVSASNISDFWKIRSRYISKTYNDSEEEYNSTIQEFERIIAIPDNSEVCLWFENDLFCQANMWFVIWLLSTKTGIKVYRVFPVIRNPVDTWKGFGISTSKMLEEAYTSKVLFTNDDMQLGANLWTAYSTNNFQKLLALSKTPSDCFQHLKEVCQAQIDRFPKSDPLGRPEQLVKELIEKGPTDFEHLFSEFSTREGIYGFGDLQVKFMYDKLVTSLT